ncbi:MAG TPA: carboxypeptidase-like regulatory domain-containing protein [Thermoanaerobaculia bacterium]|nr:carboxypeptidase-like regulatory domain-containing protein [Thermoanaerobaculia bacterium]
MTQRTVRGLVCLAMLVLLAPASRAQEETGTEDIELTGRVVDSEGHPLAGVEIWRPTEGSDDVVAAVSGPDGSFTYPFDGVFPLGACPPGWLPDESPAKGEEPMGFQIRLRPATRIAGRVVDASGEPVEGVQVQAWLAGVDRGCAVYLHTGCPGPADRRTGDTDADGRVVFESLEPGWWEVHLSDDWYLVERRLGEAGKSADEIAFALPERLVPLEGRVVDEDGAPVAGARVSVSGDRPDSEARTGTDGGYRFPRVLPGRQRLEVRHADFGLAVEMVEMAGPRTRLDVRMPRATVVQGRILGRDGSLVAAPSLRVDKEPVEVDVEGRFRFSLTPGEHEIRAEAPDRAPDERRVTAAGDPIDLDLELGRPGAIVGRIGDLAERQFVSLGLQDGSRESSAEARADEQGRFQLTGVAAGAWTLVATDNLGRTIERQVQVEEGRVTMVPELLFPPLPAVRGRVLDPDGRPIPGASLSFEQERLRVWAVADTQGRFTTRLTNGLWTVRAEPNGYAPAMAMVAVQGGAPVDVPELRLARGVVLSGSVAGLAPGEMPYVEATSEDGAWERGILSKDGTYRIPDLGPGTWIVKVRLDKRESSTRVHILPQDNVVRVDLALAEPEVPAPGS